MGASRQNYPFDQELALRTGKMAIYVYTQDQKIGATGADRITTLCSVNYKWITGL
jgi:hypothetical protein